MAMMQQDDKNKKVEKSFLKTVFKNKEENELKKHKKQKSII